MQIIRCTKKLADNIPNNMALLDPAARGWHANLFRIHRRRSVLFTHDDTLFSFIAVGLRKPDFDHFDEVFRQELFNALRWNDFSQSQIERLLESSNDISFGKSDSRSVLGSMNDMRQHILWSCERIDRIEKVDFIKLSREINETPYSAIGYSHPMEKFREFIK